MNALKSLLNALLAPLRLLLQPQKILSLPRRLISISIPAKGAWLTFLFLIVCALTVFGFWYFNPQRLDDSGAFWTRGKLAVVIPLGLLTPWVVYWALRLWLEGEASPFPDIDEAWRAGVQALAQQGVDLREMPVFLVLGSSGSDLERAVFEASRLDLPIKGVPTGRPALAWYAGPSGVYLVASQVGCLSRLASEGNRIIAEGAVARTAAEPDLDDSSGPTDIRRTLAPGAAPQREKRPAAPAAAARGADIRGTMRLSSASDDGDEDSGAASAVVEKKPIALGKDEFTLQVRRLEYLGRLLRRVRNPLCPLNGVLTLLSFPVLQWSSASGPQVQRALKEDLRAVQRAVELRCPVTALVVGLEDETGFRELVRRVGRDNSRSSRFGRGFGVWNPPTPDQLHALVAHACGAFEDWVYNLFREKNSLSKPGNARLYALLCKVRRDVQTRLGNVLAAALAPETDKASDYEPLLFSGCYFAGTGAQEDRQAFVKSVFDKLPEMQEDLEWTQAALDRERRLRRFATLAWAVDALLFVAVVAIGYLQFRS